MRGAVDLRGSRFRPAVRPRCGRADDRGSIEPDPLFIGLIAIVVFAVITAATAVTGVSTGVAAAWCAIVMVAIGVPAHFACRRYLRRSLLGLLYGARAIAPVDATPACGATADDPGPGDDAAHGRE